MGKICTLVYSGYRLSTFFPFFIFLERKPFLQTIKTIPTEKAILQTKSSLRLHNSYLFFSKGILNLKKFSCRGRKMLSFYTFFYPRGYHRNISHSTIRFFLRFLTTSRLSYIIAGIHSLTLVHLQMRKDGQRE